MSPSEMGQLIQQLDSDNIEEQEQAREQLIAHGKEAIYPLIYAFDTRPNPEKIKDILKQLPREKVITRLELVIEHPQESSPNIIRYARATLSALGESKAEICHPIDLTIDDHWTECKLSLLHQEVSGSPCQWEAVIIYLTANEQKETYSYRPTNKAETDQFIGYLASLGFRQAERSRKMRWEYYTFTR